MLLCKTIYNVQEPERPREGMGGTYFFMNENGRKVGILKPCDEEPLAPNNPKGYVGRQLGDPGWKPTVRVGEAAMREVGVILVRGCGWGGECGGECVGGRVMRSGRNSCATWCSSDLLCVCVCVWVCVCVCTGSVGRQLGDPGWKPTVRVGEAAMREMCGGMYVM